MFLEIPSFAVTPVCRLLEVFLVNCVDLYYSWFSIATLLGNGFINFQRFAVFRIDKNDHKNWFKDSIAQLGELQTEDLNILGSITGRGICFNTLQCRFRTNNS